MSLVLSNISHSYGAHRVVNDVSLTVERGEIVCLFGPSGCGKTTLLRLVAGLEPSQSGEIFLDGRTISRGTEMTVSAEARPIGLVFQDFALFPHLTIAKNIEFGLRGQPMQARKSAVDDELVAVGLTGHAQRFPHQLSGGQQQRVALARALVRRPGAMLLDEPFASLDVAMRRQLRSSVRAVLKKHHAAALLVTHDPEEALAMADRIAVMKDGRLVEVESPANLFRDPQTSQGALLFPTAQKIDGVVARGCLETPFGTFPIHSHATGDCIGVLHSRDLSIDADPLGPAVVTDCRFVGPDWLTSVVPVDEQSPASPLEVTTRDVFEVGARVRLTVRSFTKIFDAQNT